MLRIKGVTEKVKEIPALREKRRKGNSRGKRSHDKRGK